jgi:hypothetical protein
MSYPAMSIEGICDTASWPVQVIYNALRRCQNGETTCDAEIFHICHTLGGCVEYISRSPVTKKARAMALVKSGIRNYKQIMRMAGCGRNMAFVALRAVK